MKKTVLITGASSGFGKATAQLFQSKGWNVVASMRNPEKETGLGPDSFLKVKLDVTDKKSIREAVEKAIHRFGRIDVLVNNAGFGAIGVLEAASDQQIRKQFDVNLFGLIDVIKAVLPRMREQKEGVIVNLSSMGGRITIPFGTLYNATKWALEGLTEALQFELNPFGIGLKIIEPGSYRTNFNGSSMDYFGAGELGDYREIFAKFTEIAKTPGRGNPDLSEVSTTIYAAATDGTPQLRYIVGADAEQMINVKMEKGDLAYKQMVAAHFNLQVS
ncbi:SDR family oxidoreductase [Puia sp.]|jgi:NAD(P)-dependent dehydrogenase (short-subunit alcohol dehydrogenase family)|uniref:SDR family oxidoreductase n=1 Tax=Puia sp. TaxID=2045100 RepID=UPI002F41CBC6